MEGGPGADRFNGSFQRRFDGGGTLIVIRPKYQKKKRVVRTNVFEPIQNGYLADTGTHRVTCAASMLPQWGHNALTFVLLV